MVDEKMKSEEEASEEEFEDVQGGVSTEAGTGIDDVAIPLESEE